MERLADVTPGTPPSHIIDPSVYPLPDMCLVVQSETSCRRIYQLTFRIRKGELQKSAVLNPPAAVPPGTARDARPESETCNRASCGDQRAPAQLWIDDGCVWGYVPSQISVCLVSRSGTQCHYIVSTADQHDYLNRCMSGDYCESY